MKKILLVSLMAIVLVLVAGPVAAQDVQYKKKTVIDFEDLLIEGELKKPTGDYFFERKKRKFDSLIKVRKNFEAEMFKSVDDLN